MTPRLNAEGFCLDQYNANESHAFILVELPA